MWRENQADRRSPPRDLLAGRYLPAIDGLRAIAVISVVLYHVDPRWLAGGFAGVDVFFVISGVVVSLATSSLVRERFAGMTAAFYRRRVVRIVPALLVVIVVTQALSVLFIPALPKRSWDGDWTAIASVFGFGNVQLWRTSAEYFSASTELNPFTHMWSLGVEEQFYVLFPALAFWLLYRPSNTHHAFAVMAALSLASLSMAAASGQAFAFYMVFTRLWEFGAGVLLWIVLSRHAPSPNASVSAGIAGAALLAVGLLTSDPTRFPWPFALLSVAGTALLIVSSVPHNIVGPARMLVQPAMRHFGRISYSMYLWHWPVVVLMRWTAGLDTLFLKLVALLASWALGYLGYSLIEKPVRQSPFVRNAPTWLVICGGLFAMGVVAAGVVASIKFRPLLTISVTGDRQSWSMTEQGSGQRACTIQPTTTKGGAQLFTPRPCAAPALNRTLFIVGDSHAMGYQRLSGNLARDYGIRVLNFGETGCSVLPAVAPTASCDAFTASALSQVLQQARPGDWLFLPGLRVTHLTEPNGLAIRTRPYREGDLRTFAASMRPLLDRGVMVIMEAPKPVYAIRQMRCADWFNRSNPACRASPLSADAQREHGSAVSTAWAKLQAIDSRIRVFDPFPTLCPGPVCTPFLGTIPVTYDGDHLSGVAQDLLTGPIAEFLIEPRTSKAPREQPSARD